MAKKVNIAGKRIKIKPMSAEKGLNAIVEFARVLDKAMPYLGNMADSSRRIRVFSLVRMVAEIEELPDMLFNVVSLSTEISVGVLKEEATVKELLDVMAVVIKINNWNEFWATAYSLRIVDGEGVVQWAVARIQNWAVRN